MNHLQDQHGMDARVSEVTCPLCVESTSRDRDVLSLHVARHMEEIALAILPSGVDSDDELTDGSSELDEDSRGWGTGKDAARAHLGEAPCKKLTSDGLMRKYCARWRTIVANTAMERIKQERMAQVARVAQAAQAAIVRRGCPGNDWNCEPEELKKGKKAWSTFRTFREHFESEHLGDCRIGGNHWKCPQCDHVSFGEFGSDLSEHLWTDHWA